MDDADFAADYQSGHNQDSIARVLASAAGHRSGPGPRSCEWCGAEISERRLAAMPGCSLCVECQTIKERLKHGL